ncbi:MAG: hypothetical protein ABL915_09295 [Gallionella sp.]
MNEIEVRNIIEATLKSGSKTPSLFDLPKILGVKSKLENCDSISEVLAILDSNRSFIAKSFGLHDSVLDESVTKLKALEMTA